VRADGKRTESVRGGVTDLGGGGQRPNTRSSRPSRTIECQSRKKDEKGRDHGAKGLGYFRPRGYPKVSPKGREVKKGGKEGNKKVQAPWERDCRP